MKTYHQLVDFASKYKNIVVALGMFDGLHIGHQKIIRTAAEQASRIHGTTFVFSFTNHPRTIVDSLGAPRRISSEQVSLRILRNLGVDVLVEIPFTHDFADTSPEEFIHLLYRHFSPRYIVVGENYTFGKKGAGTPPARYGKTVYHRDHCVFIRFVRWGTNQQYAHSDLYRTGGYNARK